METGPAFCIKLFYLNRPPFDFAKQFDAKYGCVHGLRSGSMVSLPGGFDGANGNWANILHQIILLKPSAG
ncbi:MAG: hypothetical protein K9M54_12645 [Kiritimatiellales bacterium]|nr:hypothetical protein [Kiritimatiellales bacterium]MCF7864111.1 hypothetical protein [Kiritimatiellales bacterium]